LAKIAADESIRPAHDVPVLGQIRSTQRMLNQAILDRNSGLGQWLRLQLGQLEDK